MSEKRLPGKPRAKYIEDAVNIIRDSEHAVSTNELVDRFDLDRYQAMTLRRGLKREESKGKIMMVGRASDNSHTWARCHCEKATIGTEEISRGAAFAAENYLRGKLGDVRVNIDETAQVIASTLQTEAALEGDS
jgi:hypothetical protein